MKTRVALLVLGVGVALAAPAVAQLAPSKRLVIGSPHDVRSVQTTGDACAGCHTPHNANTQNLAAGQPGGPKALLWNRTVPTAFTVYDATTNSDFKGGTVALGAGSAVSLLCMSCHDGAQPLSAVIPGNTPTGMTFKTGNASSLTGAGSGAGAGTDLSNDHPVGFVYDTSLAGQGTPARYVQNPDPALVKLFGTGTTRRVECGSCHDAHNNSLGGFLRSTNANSAMCLACHL
jgi:predicted CXXCH cytochrome family protein